MRIAGSAGRLAFPPVAGRDVVAGNDCVAMTSDTGTLPLGSIDRAASPAGRLAG